MTRTGWRSKKWGVYGVYFHCTGPDPKGPAPGERTKIVIYDKDDNIVRRLEERLGKCLDPGHVNLFPGAANQTARYIKEIVDFDTEGNETILAGSEDNMSWFQSPFSAWVRLHGVKAA